MVFSAQARGTNERRAVVCGGRGGEHLLAHILHLAAQVDVVAVLAHVVVRALRRVRGLGLG